MSRAKGRCLQACWRCRGWCPRCALQISTHLAIRQRESRGLANLSFLPVLSSTAHFIWQGNHGPFKNCLSGQTVSASTNPTDRVLNRRPKTFFRLRVRYFLVHLRAWPVPPSITIEGEGQGHAKSTWKLANEAKGFCLLLSTLAFRAAGHATRSTLLDYCSL